MCFRPSQPLRIISGLWTKRSRIKKDSEEDSEEEEDEEKKKKSDRETCRDRERQRGEIKFSGAFGAFFFKFC